MLEEAPAVNDGSEPTPEGRGTLSVAVREFIYPQANKSSLEKVNFTLQPGQMLGFAGRPARQEHYSGADSAPL